MIFVNVIFTTILITNVNGLRCMTCENARSHQECDTRGVMKECMPNELACAIEERKINLGPERKIFKHCKQPLACDNNQVQNNRPAWWPTQCNSNFPNMVCRCCCQSDACNIGPHQCFGRQPVRACRPRHRPPIPGSVDCSNRNRVGSACTFSCPDGYNLVGSVTSTCNDDGTWSSLAPRCAQALCNPPHISLRNGAISCSRRNILNSVCTFSCDPGFTLNGARTSTCQPNGFEAADWSTNTPTGPRESSCNRISCPDQGANTNGNISCSNGNLFESSCTFTCESPSEIYPPDVVSNVCLNDGRWDKDTPCCARPCPEQAVVDMVIVLDSSSSVGEDGWRTMLAFTELLISKFTLGHDSLEVAVIRYNREVDTVNEIDLDNDYNQTELFNAIRNLPYDGSGTRTGQAINFTREVILAEGHGHRLSARDLVVVLTDGRSQDDVAIPSQLLRDEGALTYAIGIRPEGARVDFNIEDDLMSIAGAGDRYFFVDGGFSSLNDAFAIEITEQICRDPCDLVGLNED